ncbi:MAG: COX15/CtaA family protein [Myxococcota bacterium]
MTSHDVLNPDPEDSARSSLSLGFALLAGLTFCLIVLGALVRAYDAGLACPDWPLCYGEVIPNFNLEVAFEWGHRVLAAAISMGLLGLTVALVRHPLKRDRLRGRLIWTWLVLAIQVVFGALTVWLRLAPWTVSVHLVLGNTFCLLLLWTARDLAEESRSVRASEPLPSAFAPLAFAVTLCVFLQMVLGGWVSSNYAGLACTHFPSCNGQQWVPTLQGLVGVQILHRFNGFLLLAGYGALAWLTLDRGRLGRFAMLGFGLVLAQIVVGAANVWLRLPVAVTALHSAVAAAIVLVTAMCVRDLIRAGVVYAKPAAQGRVAEFR